MGGDEGGADSWGEEMGVGALRSPGERFPGGGVGGDCDVWCARGHTRVRRPVSRPLSLALRAVWVWPLVGWVWMARGVGGESRPRALQYDGSISPCHRLSVSPSLSAIPSCCASASRVSLGDRLCCASGCPPSVMLPLLPLCLSCMRRPLVWRLSLVLSSLSRSLSLSFSLSLSLLACLLSSSPPCRSDARARWDGGCRPRAVLHEMVTIKKLECLKQV